MSGRAGGVVTRLGGADLAAVLDGLGRRGLGRRPRRAGGAERRPDVRGRARRGRRGRRRGGERRHGSRADPGHGHRWRRRRSWSTWSGRRTNPFVVTGAMRNPTLPGADGPANVVAAVRVAAAAHEPLAGALVVVQRRDPRGATRRARRTARARRRSSRRTLGPIGHVVEGSPRFLRRPFHGLRAGHGVRPRDRLAATRVASVHSGPGRRPASRSKRWRRRARGWWWRASGSGTCPARWPRCSASWPPHAGRADLADGSGERAQRHLRGGRLRARPSRARPGQRRVPAPVQGAGTAPAAAGGRGRQQRAASRRSRSAASRSSSGI